MVRWVIAVASPSTRPSLQVEAADKTPDFHTDDEHGGCLIMAHPDDTEPVSLSDTSPDDEPLDDDQPDAEYARITQETVQNLRTQEQAEEERCKAAAPPPGHAHAPGEG
jgi:hypothetical protein